MNGRLEEEMIRLIETILLAFVLYGVVLPLIGIAIGFLLRVVVPYLLGGLVGIVALGNAGVLSQSLTLLFVIAVSWGALVLVVRTSKCLRSLVHLNWSEGHYLSAFRLLTLGGLTAEETERGHPWRLSWKTAAHGH